MFPIEDKFRISRDVFSYRRIADAALRKDTLFKTSYGRMSFNIIDTYAVMKELGMKEDLSRAPYTAALYFDSMLIDTAMLKDKFTDTSTISTPFVIDMLRRSLLRSYLDRWAGPPLGKDACRVMRETIRSIILPFFSKFQFGLPESNDPDACFRYLITNNSRITEMAYRRTHANRTYRINRQLVLAEDGILLMHTTAKYNYVYPDGGDACLAITYDEPAESCTRDPELDRKLRQLTQDLPDQSR